MPSSLAAKQAKQAFSRLQPGIPSPIGPSASIARGRRWRQNFQKGFPDVRTCKTGGGAYGRAEAGNGPVEDSGLVPLRVLLRQGGVGLGCVICSRDSAFGCLPSKI